MARLRARRDTVKRGMHRKDIFIVEVCVIASGARCSSCREDVLVSICDYSYPYHVSPPASPVRRLS